MSPPAGAAGSPPAFMMSITASARFRALVGVERPVDAERHPPRRPAGAGLHHIDLAPRGVDPDPEPGERAVPEDRVPVGGAEPVDRAGANA